MAETLDRRSTLKKGLVLGGVGTAAGLLASASGAGCAQAQETLKLTLDMACIGETFRMTPTPGNKEGDLSGNTFYVEGWLYPEGTIGTSRRTSIPRVRRRPACGYAADGS